MRIGSALWGEAVEQSALGGRVPEGSRVRTRRRGNGSSPSRDQRAVPVPIARVRSPSPDPSRGASARRGAGSATPAPGKEDVALRPWDDQEDAGCVREVARGERHPCGPWSLLVSAARSQAVPVPGDGRRSHLCAGCHEEASHRRPRRTLCCAHRPLVCCHWPRGSRPSGVVARTHPHGKALHCAGPGKRHDHRHHDPTAPRAAHRPLLAGEGALTARTACAAGAAPPPLTRCSDHQVAAGFCWPNGLDNAQEPRATDGSGRPAGSLAHPGKATPGVCLLMTTGTQRCRHGAASLGPQGSGSPEHPFPPRRSGPPWPNRRENRSHGIGKGQRRSPEGRDGALIRVSLPSETPLCLPSFPEMDIVKLRALV